MKRPRILLFWASLVATAAALAPQASTAKDLSGRLGVGLEQSLAGVSGLAIRYFPTEAVGLTTTLGVDITIVEKEGDDSKIATGFVGSVGAAFHFARSLHAHFGLGLRASVGWRSLESTRLIDPDATASDVQLNIEIPLFLEFFLSDHFSVGVATGLLINFVPSSGATLDSEGAGSTKTPNTIGIGIGAGSVTGTLSILYYF